MEKSSSSFRINHVTISNYHKIDFQIDFSTPQGPSYEYFLIGPNGSFKSTVLELIYAIFASFNAPAIMKNKYVFNYEIEYVANGYTVSLTKIEKKYDLRITSPTEKKVTEKGLSLDSVSRKLRTKELLPERIITFYSGENDRLKKICTSALRGYYRSFRNALNPQYINSNASTPFLPTKRYIHIENTLIPLFLLISMMDPDTNALIRKHCHIKSITRISFYTDLMPKIKQLVPNGKQEKQIQEYIRNILASINEDITKKLVIGQDKEHTNFFITLENFGDAAAIPWVYAFYEALPMVFTGTLHTYFESDYAKGDLPDTALSQGQRQWIKLIGSIALAKNSSFLMLMDEPDVFMNPRWKYQFNSDLANSNLSMPSGMSLIVTHDPLMINGVPKEHIRLLKRTHNGVKITEPTCDTYGLGIDGLLKSEYYGLETTYDKKTSDEFYERMLLYSKALNNELTEDSEKDRLYELTKKLGRLPVFNSSIDYLYLDFLKAYDDSLFADTPYLTPEELDEKNQKLCDIIESLYERRE